MPFPHAAPHLSALPGSVYSDLVERLAAHDGPVYPLHVGDTWMEPLAAAQAQALQTADHPGMHRYSPPRGLPALVDALVEKLRARNGLMVERSGVLVTGGATAGLAQVMQALLSPGDEVAILAPFWPLIRGHVQLAHGVPVEVPFYDRVTSLADAVQSIRERVGPRTVGLYVSTPSNPTGRVLPGEWLQAIAALARELDLWLISDETYENYVFSGRHESVGRWAPERTITAFTFSKAYGMAGTRVGYLCGPQDILAATAKVHTHALYCAPRPAQEAALVALREGDAWIAKAKRHYQAAGVDAARVLGLPAPEGSTFLFLDVRERPEGVMGLLESLVQRGMLLAPGASFGQEYASHVRLCFTAAPPEEVATAVRVLRGVLAG